MTVFTSEDLYLNRAKFVMKYLGIWVPPETEMWLHKLYRLFMIALQYLFLFFQIIYINQVWGDLEAVSQASYLLFTQACLCFKVTVLHLNMNLLKDLLKRMNEKIFLPETDKHERILQLQAKRIKRLLLAFMISSQTTCGLWALKPLFDDAGSRSFPFDMWMPVKADCSPQYELGYAFQLLTISISAYMYFGVDSVVLSMVIFACAQLQIIKDKILKINSIQGINIDYNEKRKILSKNYDKLVNCIKHHQTIISYVFMLKKIIFHSGISKVGRTIGYTFFAIVTVIGFVKMCLFLCYDFEFMGKNNVFRFTEMVENAYHTFLLFQLVGSVGLICMSALRILVVDWRSMQFFSILTYLSVMISQLFVSCWCGHELTATSENLHVVLYTCSWYDQDIKFMRILCFSMMCMRRPIVLRAGHYISLSRQTFVSILRMSYSYFAVLNQTR